MNFHVLYFDELDSTNNLALAYAREGRPEGTVIVADYQSRGRGKPGRSWISARGKDLLFSLLLRPKIPISEAPLLRYLACRTVAYVLKESYQIEAQIKRPNDLLVNGKKICGVLVESSTRNEELEAVVIGIGLNVNSEPPEIPSQATSLKLCLGRDLNRRRLLRNILDRLALELQGAWTCL